MIIKFKSLKFYIYPDDHGNPHVHVVGKGAKAKIYLESLEIVASNGFSRKSLNTIVKKVKEYKQELLDAWREYHGKN